MKRFIAFSFGIIVTLNAFVSTVCAIKIDAIASLKEGWSDAYSRLLVDSTFESGNQINYARAFATNEGDFLYLKLDATDGPAPDGISPEGIEILTDNAFFACFLNESVSSDYDKNLYSFEYAIDRSFEGFTAEMCILYKSGIPDNISLTFVLTDNTGIKSARLPFSYATPEEEIVNTAEQTTVKTQSTTKKITTTAHTTTAKSKNEPQTTITETAVSVKNSSTAATTKKEVNKKNKSTLQNSESNQETSDAKEPSTVVSSTVQTINAGTVINLEQAKEFKKKKLIASCGCAVAIISACVAGTVNFKKRQKNDNDD
jgi:hypothetical protein